MCVSQWYAGELEAGAIGGVFLLKIRLPPRSTRTDTLFPYTTLFRSTAIILGGAPASPPVLLWRAADMPRAPSWRLDAAHYPVRGDFQTRFQDMDVNGHLNNVAIATLFESGRVFLKIGRAHV